MFVETTCETAYLYFPLQGVSSSSVSLQNIERTLISNQAVLEHSKFLLHKVTVFTVSVVRNNLIALTI